MNRDDRKKIPATGIVCHHTNDLLSGMKKALGISQWVACVMFNDGALCFLANVLGMTIYGTSDYIETCIANLDKEKRDHLHKATSEYAYIRRLLGDGMGFHADDHIMRRCDAGLLVFAVRTEKAIQRSDFEAYCSAYIDTFVDVIKAHHPADQDVCIFNDTLYRHDVGV